MSFNKKIIFPEPPKGFSVKSVMPPPVSLEKLNSKSLESFEEGKQKAKEFYLEEIKQLKDQLAVKQNELLDQLNQRTEQLLDTLDKNLPNLVMEIVQKILPSIKLSASEIEGNVRALIKEFSDEEEKLEVFLCPEDLKLLKALGRGSSTEEDQEKADNQNEDGFASAIAGIFDNLDGEDSVLPDLPRVSFFEDATLSTGDIQIKSKFGLLDGRIATKIRKIEEELTENG